MEVFLVYLWLKLPFLISGCVLAAIIMVCLALAAATVIDNIKNWSLETRRDEIPLLRKRRNKWFCSALVMLAIAGAVPDRVDVAMLVGTHYAVQLSGSPEGQKVTTLIRRKANEYLDEQVKEVKK